MHTEERNTSGLAGQPVCEATTQIVELVTHLGGKGECATLIDVNELLEDSNIQFHPEISILSRVLIIIIKARSLSLRNMPNKIAECKE